MILLWKYSEIKKGTGLRHLTLFYKIQRSDRSLSKFINLDLRLLLTHKTAEGNFRLFKFHANFRGQIQCREQPTDKILTEQKVSKVSIFYQKPTMLFHKLSCYASLCFAFCIPPLCDALVCGGRNLLSLLMGLRYSAQNDL